MDRHGDYRPLPPELLPPLFVAWDERLSGSSGTVHNVVRYAAAQRAFRDMQESSPG